jgi:hypothetical protein
MAGKTRIPRSRGAMSGLLLILLGIWGALIPFVGPYFHYAYTPDKAWTYTTGRLWLEILPGIAVALGGFIVLASARRPLAILGAFVAVLGGAWFVVGNLLSALWNHGIPEAGIPVGGNLTRLALEELGFFIGLGVIIVFFAALALGRFAVVGVKETALAERDAAAVAADGDAVADQPSGPVTDQPAGPFANTDDRLQPAGAAFPAGPEQSPAATSQFPVTETEASAAETEAPAAVTQAPAAETEAPAAETEAAAAVTQAPAAVTQAPAAVTQAPAADTQPPAAETLAPAERGPFTPASEYPPSAPFPSGGTTTTGA